MTAIGTKPPSGPTLSANSYACQSGGGWQSVTWEGGARRSGCSLALPPLPPLSRSPTCGYTPAAAVLVFGGSFFLAEVLPALFERVYVKPSELELERPYIQRNIAFTREAYNLVRITVKPFPAEQDLTFQSLKDNSRTINNIRLWDWQPLMDTYAQLQEIRTYYRFLDVDVDRYNLDDSYQQVTLAAHGFFLRHWALFLRKRPSA